MNRINGFYKTSYFERKRIFCGTAETFIATESEILGIGDNAYCQQGAGPSEEVPGKVVCPNVVSSSSFPRSLIDGGDKNSFLVTVDGKLFVAGKDSHGQLGLGKERNKPKYNVFIEHGNFPFGTKIAAISCGNHHTLYLTNEQKVFASGYNSYGQLGDGTTTSQNEPVRVKYLDSFNIVQVVAGHYHSYMLSDSKIFGCGANDVGQLAQNDTIDRALPTEITYFSENGLKVITCTGGHEHTYYLCRKMSGGKNIVYSSGNNGNGQLGTNDLEYRCLPGVVRGLENVNVIQMAAGYYFGVFLSDTYKIFGVGDIDGVLRTADTALASKEYNVAVKLEIFDSRKIVQIEAGGFHSVYLSSNGEVFLGGRTNPDTNETLRDSLKVIGNSETGYVCKVLNVLVKPKARWVLKRVLLYADVWIRCQY